MQPTRPTAVPCRSFLRQSTASRVQERCQRRRTRGQTEPLAALVAVAVVCVAISIYAGFLSGLVPQLGEDRSVAEGTSERVWHAISEDGIYNASAPLADEIAVETLPQGHYVAISVTYVGEDGPLESIAAGTFDAHADPVTLDPPADAERHERAIPIKHRPGDIQPGTLQVVVWS